MKQQEMIIRLSRGEYNGDDTSNLADQMLNIISGYFDVTHEQACQWLEENRILPTWDTVELTNEFLRDVLKI